MAVIIGTNAHEKIFGTGDADQISGLDGKDEIFAGGGDDSITGGLGNDVIDGGDGTDTAVYAGNAWQYTVIQDWQGNYYVSTGDPGLVEGPNTDPNQGEGTDRLINVEKLSFNGVVYNIDARVQSSKQYGEATDDYIATPTRFSEGVLLGLGGNDTLVGRANSQDWLYGGDGDDSLVGNGSGLVGNGGPDILDGGAGADYMQGGENVEHYYVDNAADVVVDTGSPRVGNIHNKLSDIIYATVSYDAVTNVEVLDFLGTADVNSTGNAEANTIKGNSGDNSISGAGGDDTLRGRGGDDTIIGGDGDDHIEGNEGNDSLEGGAGNDALYGGAGIDTLVGGAGNDNYFDIADDTVVELSGGGIDTVHMNSSYDLAEHIENANVSGSSQGNALNNVITDASGSGTLWGMDGNDWLDGQGTLYGGNGNDRLIGGAIMDGGSGNDIYIVYDGTEVVSDTSGRDQVRSYVSYVLGTDLDDLALLNPQSGAPALDLNGTGNDLNNELIGNNGNNQLWGGSGNDRLYGMEGNDTLTGGAGNDTLEGVYGPDDYVFSAAAVNGRDMIIGFGIGLDRLVFTGADYGFASGHVLTAAEFTVGSTALGTNAQFIWNDVTSRLYWDADGTGAGAAIELALIGNGAVVTKDDLFFT